MDGFHSYNSSRVLKPSERVSLSRQNIFFDINPKSKYEIYYNRRPKGKKGNIDKPEAYARNGYIETLAQIGTNTK